MGKRSKKETESQDGLASVYSGKGQVEPPDPSALRVVSGEVGEPSAATDPLLYLYSNNCIQIPSENLRIDQLLALCGILSPYHKRQAHTLFSNVCRLTKIAPSEGHLGFFTLTTKDNCTSKKDFSRRWHSMNTNYWKASPFFREWIGCFEQQERGAWHLHILVVLTGDIRTGVDLGQFAQRNYRSASPYLRALWRDLRGACQRYGFGRHELLPVKSNPEAMARYIGKYVSKHIGQRDESSKGLRLITASRDWTKNSNRFAWNTDGGKEWRRKLGKFARYIQCDDLEALYDRLGPSWAYRYLDVIYDIDTFVEAGNEALPF